MLEALFRLAVAFKVTFRLRHQVSKLRDGRDRLNIQLWDLIAI